MLNRKQPNYTKIARYVHSVVSCGHLSGIVLPLTLIPCLLGWIQLFFLGSQITLTCLIRVAVKRKVTTSNKKGGKAIVEQILVSEERNRSKRAGL